MPDGKRAEVSHLRSVAVIMAVSGILLLFVGWDISPDGYESMLSALLDRVFAEVPAVLGLTVADSIKGGALELEGARSITTFQSGSTIYAAVASYIDDGVQIISLADPENLTAAGKIDDLDDANLVLDGASDVATFESGGITYAAVTSGISSGVQIMKLTDSNNAILDNPTAVGRTGGPTLHILHLLY